MVPIQLLQLPLVVLTGKILSTGYGYNARRSGKNSMIPVTYTKPKFRAPGNIAIRNPFNAFVSSLRTLSNRAYARRNYVSRPIVIKNPLNNLIRGLTSAVTQAIQPAPEEDYDSIIRSFMPNDAQILTPKYPSNAGTYEFADLDGDSRNELIASYRQNNEIKTIVLKKQNELWQKITEVSNPQYENINYRGAVEITGNGKKQLILGLEEKNSAPSLFGYSLEDFSLNEIFKRNYDRFEIVRNRNNPSEAYIAVWNKRTSGDGSEDRNDMCDRPFNSFVQNDESSIQDINSNYVEDSYDIEVLTWNDTQFEPVRNTASYYYRNVVPYYVNKIKRNPDTPSSWYNLAEALVNANAYRDALIAIKAGMAYDINSELKDKFMELRNKIIGQ